jgi:hypothetical protein
MRAARPAAFGRAPQGTQYSMRMRGRFGTSGILSRLPSDELRPAEAGRW